MKLPFLPLLLTALVAGLACPGPAQEKVTADAIIKATGIGGGLALVIADDAALVASNMSRFAVVVTPPNSQQPKQKP